MNLSSVYIRISLLRGLETLQRCWHKKEGRSYVSHGIVILITSIVNRTVLKQVAPLLMDKNGWA